MLRSLALLGLVAHSQAWYKDSTSPRSRVHRLPYPACIADSPAALSRVVVRERGDPPYFLPGLYS
jgi:hypothetical protein